jgi:hypothetical protein
MTQFARLKTGTRPWRAKSLHLYKVHYRVCESNDVWLATDGEGYQEYIKAGTRYEAAQRLGILNLLKRPA